MFKTKCGGGTKGFCAVLKKLQDWLERFHLPYRKRAVSETSFSIWLQIFSKTTLAILFSGTGKAQGHQEILKQIKR